MSSDAEQQPDPGTNSNTDAKVTEHQSDHGPGYRANQRVFEHQRLSSFSGRGSACAVPV